MTILPRSESAQVAAGAVSVDVRGLRSFERVVALYASDMPTRRRAGTQDEVSAWIVQGAQRLGLEELRRRAEFFRGHRLLDMANLVTPQVQARHEQRFPSARRLSVAEREAANHLYVVGMTEAARRRRSFADVDGGCPCGDTGWIHCSDPDPDLSYALECPVHRPAWTSRPGPFGDESTPRVAA